MQINNVFRSIIFVLSMSHGWVTVCSNVAKNKEVPYQKKLRKIQPGYRLVPFEKTFRSIAPDVPDLDEEDRQLLAENKNKLSRNAGTKTCVAA